MDTNLKQNILTIFTSIGHAQPSCSIVGDLEVFISKILSINALAARSISLIKISTYNKDNIDIDNISLWVSSMTWCIDFNMIFSYHYLQKDKKLYFQYQLYTLSIWCWNNEIILMNTIHHLNYQYHLMKILFLDRILNK